MALLISVQGARVVVETGGPDVVYRRLRATLPRGMVIEVPDADAEADARYEVCADGLDGTFCILRDGAVVDRVRSVRGLSGRLRNHVEFEVAVRARTALFVHAGVVAWRGRAILIPGASNAGKSTLVAEMARRGATYYSDEYAVIDEAGMVHSYARRLAATRRLIGAPERPPIEPVLLIATTYVPGATWAPVVVEGARAILPLLDHLLALKDEPQRALRFGARLGSRLVALQGPRPDAKEVAPAILGFVDRVLNGMTAQTALAAAQEKIGALRRFSL